SPMVRSVPVRCMAKALLLYTPASPPVRRSSTPVARCWKRRSAPCMAASRCWPRTAPVSTPPSLPAPSRRHGPGIHPHRGRRRLSTYAIGDLQGCLAPFEALLDTIDFKSDRDRLLLAGDLVNRGPDSLGTLRRVHQLRDNVTMVLGH